jgi:hypothetical protein
MTTRVIFKSPKVRIDFTNDVYSIVAIEDIGIGEMIVLENVVWSHKMETLISAVICDRELRKELYPRNTDDPGTKAMNNMFDFSGSYVLGRFCSKFNHICTPNCHLDLADHVNDSKVYGIWTHRKIKANEELTIDYVNGGNGDMKYHDSMKKGIGFSCDCTDQFVKDGMKRANIHRKLGAHFRDRDKDVVCMMVDKFFESQDGFATIEAQKIAEKKSKYVKII